MTPSFKPPVPWIVIAFVAIGCGGTSGSDGGSSIEDGGVIDSGVVEDAGQQDAGSVDAGVDAGSADAGSPDAGSADAGLVDAGSVDAGSVDAGSADAGVDAGLADAGSTDAGNDAGVDAGGSDAGAVDGGSTSNSTADAGVDAGPADAGAVDAGADAGASDAGVAHDAGSVDAGELDGGELDGGAVLPAIPLGGCSISAYWVAATFGGSAPINLFLDTGSSTTAVAANSTICPSCQACVSPPDGGAPDCSQISPAYTPGATATDLSVNMSMDSSKYGDNSFWAGEAYSDTVQLGPEPGVPLDFVAIDSQLGFFEYDPCYTGNPANQFEGIIGMGPPDLTLSMTDTYMTALQQQAGTPNIFAVQLCGTGGHMWIGGYDPSYTTAAPHYTPILDPAALGDSDGGSDAGTSGVTRYFQVTISDLLLGSADWGYDWASENANVGGALVDTGTTLLGLPQTVFTDLASAVAEAPGANGTPEFQTAFAPCVDGNTTGCGPQAAAFFTAGACVPLASGVTKAQLDQYLPPLTIQLPDEATGGTTNFSLTLPATESYLIATDSTNTVFCPAVFPSDPLPPILGVAVLASYVTIFDSVNDQIGFAEENSCR